MKPDRRAIMLFLAGVILMTGICIAQITSDLVHGSVYYILLGIYGLWVLRHYRYLSAIGAIATIAMAVGYFLSPEHSPGELINRIFSILTVWSGVIFTAHFRKLFQREQIYKKQLKALFENVSEAILLIDTHGRIILGNPGAERILGFTRQELVNMQIDELIPDRFRPNHDKHRHQFGENPSTRRIGIGREVFALRKDKTEVPVEVSLSTYRDSNELFIIAFVTDITRRKEQEAKIAAQYEQMQQCNIRLEEQVQFRTSELEIINQDLVREIEERKVIEERLRKSQLMYKAIANNFPDGIIGVLDRDLRYVFVEGKELATSRDNRDRKTDRNLFADIPNALITNSEDKLRPVFDGKNVQFELIVGLNYYEVTATPFSGSDFSITEILIVVRDITRHKKFEDDLLRSLEKEKQLNVLKSRFVTSVSHEFRTPLSTILSSAYLLENYHGEGVEVQRITHINRIKRAVNSLTELLDDFLSLGKLEEGKIKVVYSEFCLKDFLDELASEMEPIKNKDQQLRVIFRGDDESEMVLLDKTLMTNIINNLLSNAIKYSLADTEILIEASIVNDILKIQVTDHGMGIPDKEQKHIFKRFFRAQNAINIQGTGLGLSLVRKYVKLMKGHISFVSKIGQGSTFTVTIPVTVPSKTSITTSKFYA